MPKKDPRVDAYIAKSADFAKPILKQLRASVHAACPQVADDIKWGAPHFMFQGMLCGMAAFKQHCAFGFWHKGMREALKALGKSEESAGQFGCLRSVDDLPSKAVFTRLVKQAMKLNESGSNRPKPPKRTNPKNARR